jgi:hypothetical protein
VSVKPVIVVADERDGPRDALRGDVSARYGHAYDVVAATGTSEARDLLARLAREGRTVAVVIAYLRQSGLDGIDLLGGAREHHAGAVRVLTIDVGDRAAEAPIARALTLNHVDFYVGTPWASPEEELYPVLAEAVRQWARAHLPRYEKAKVIGDPASPIVRSLARRAELMNTAIGIYPPDSPEGVALMHAHGVGRDVRARAVVLATGVTYRRLEATGVDRLVGRGIFYGAGTAEARAMGDVRACIVGAGNSAGQLAAALARPARASRSSCGATRSPRACPPTS